MVCGLIVGTNLLISEIAVRKLLVLAIGIYAAGYGIGASLGGTAMVGLINAYGWRSVFFVGGVMSVVSLLLVVALLRESASSVYNRLAKSARQNVDPVARLLGYTEP